MQAEKIELVKRLLETDDEIILQQIKEILDNYPVLPQFVINGIKKISKASR